MSAPAVLSSSLLSHDISISASASRWRTAGCVLCGDLFAITFVFAIAGLGRRALTPAYHGSSYLDLLLSIVMILAGFWIQDLYPGVLLHAAEEMRRIFFSVTIVFLVMASYAFLWHSVDEYSRSVFLVSWASAAPLVLLGRQVVRGIFKHSHWWGVSAVILGSGAAAERVSRTLKDSRWGIRIVGVLSERPAPDWPEDLPPVLGSLTSATTAARMSEYAIVAMPQKSSQEIRDIIQTCCFGFRNILIVPDMPGLFSLGIVPRQMGSEIGFEVPQRLCQRRAAIVKRTLDFFLSLACITCLLPLFAILSVCVTLSSRGGVLYGQERIGRNGSLFRALKFRTMVSGADSILAEYLAVHPEYLFEWQRDHKLKKDPRVTTAGRWMRRLSLDELPQLFNVLVGHMSLVGPRPIVAAEIQKYGPCYGLYSRVRPGITGLWQVSGRNNTTYNERVALDQFYVSNWSIWMDIYILVRTVRTVITAEGAY